MFKGMIALAAVTAFAVIAQPAPASAADAPVRTSHVAYRDLDLASAEGLAMLDRRITRAARAACRVQGPTLRGALAERTCVRRALQSAYVQRDQLLAAVQHRQVAGR